MEDHERISPKRFKFNGAPSLAAAFPSSTAKDVQIVLGIFYDYKIEASTSTIGKIHLAGEEIYIPARIYSEEAKPETLTFLTETQALILACLFSRHHNGYIRQKQIPTMLTSRELWVIPFIIQLLGEYVIEIIKDIQANISALNGDYVRVFAGENLEFITLTRQRIISYWDVYHRSSYVSLRDYPALQAMITLGLWDNVTAKRLLISKPLIG